MKFVAWRAYTNADVWAVGPDTDHVHVMVFPIPGVVTGLRAQHLAKVLSEVHKGDGAPGRKGGLADIEA